jgi:hypothetical protein
VGGLRAGRSDGKQNQCQNFEDRFHKSPNLGSRAARVAPQTEVYATTIHFDAGSGRDVMSASIWRVAQRIASVYIF